MRNEDVTSDQAKNFTFKLSNGQTTFILMEMFGFIFQNLGLKKEKDSTFSLRKNGILSEWRLTESNFLCSFEKLDTQATLCKNFKLLQPFLSRPAKAVRNKRDDLY